MPSLSSLPRAIALSSAVILFASTARSEKTLDYSTRKVPDLTAFEGAVDKLGPILEAKLFEIDYAADGWRSTNENDVALDLTSDGDLKGRIDRLISRLNETSTDARFVFAPELPNGDWATGGKNVGFAHIVCSWASESAARGNCVLSLADNAEDFARGTESSTYKELSAKDVELPKVTIKATVTAPGDGTGEGTGGEVCLDDLDCSGDGE